VRLTALLFVVCCGSAASAQGTANNGSITGTVLRQADNRPIPSSRAQLVGITPVRPSDAAGVFSFNRLWSGAYRLQVSAIGYLPFDTVVTVRPGAAVRIKVRLRAVPVELSSVTIREAATVCPEGFYRTGARGRGTKPCAPVITPSPGTSCGRILVIGMRSMICTSADLLVRITVRHEETLLGQNSRIMQAAQEAVTKSGLKIEQVRQLNDATWLIIGRGIPHGADTASVRIELQEVGPNDTKVRVSLVALAALGTRRQADAARQMVAIIRQRMD
jgi:hypothetical protein